MTEPATGSAEPVPPRDGFLTRRAARVILLDAADRVLLMEGGDPGRPGFRYWFTMGGGLDDGETPAEGAARELYEEIGLRLPTDRLTGPVHHEAIRFVFDGEWYEQEQDYFAARVDSWQVDRSRHSEIEIAVVGEFRWWTAEELEATAEVRYPAVLPALVRTVAGVV